MLVNNDTEIQNDLFAVGMKMQVLYENTKLSQIVDRWHLWKGCIHNSPQALCFGLLAWCPEWHTHLVIRRAHLNCVCLHTYIFTCVLGICGGAMHSGHPFSLYECSCGHYR